MIDLDMGKYAAFVWPAYAASAIVLGAMVAQTLAAARRWKAEAERREPSERR